ncbi:Crp/Fnr family transcriptional regulator [Flavitalea flava]
MYSQSLLKNFTGIAGFTENELITISEKFVVKQYAKNDFLLKAGKVCTKLFFIKEGLIRMYQLRENGKEITNYLACDGSFVVSAKSFLLQKPYYDNIQCLEDSTILEISFEEMQGLYQAIPNWNIVGRKLMEESVLCLANLLENQHHIKAKDRYLKFLQEKPLKIINQTPVQYIATFLGIAPESLSRIRNEITRPTTIS